MSCWPPARPALTGISFTGGHTQRTSGRRRALGTRGEGAGWLSAMPREAAAVAQAKQAAAKRAGQLQHEMESQSAGISESRQPRLTDAERKARRAKAQKEWAQTARAQLSEEQLLAVKTAMGSLKTGEIQTPAFCAAVLQVFREVQDEVARVRLVRAMAMLVPPKFRALYHLLATGRDAADVTPDADRAERLEAHEIEPGLFVGGWNAVQSASALHARGISHVLTVGPEEVLADEVRDDRGFTRKVVTVNDMAEVDMLAHLDSCVAFMKEALSSGSVRAGHIVFLPTELLSTLTTTVLPQVLVHCWAGQSRSVTVVCAYLLLQSSETSSQKNADPGQAVDIVLEQVRSRGCTSASPNSGFMEQLHWFAAIHGDNRRERAAAELAYRVFRMEAIRREYGTLMLEMLPPDVTAATNREDVDTIYRCRGCREVIFTSDNVLPHTSGEGQTAFTWHRRDRSCNIEETTCNTLHLEPMTWMGIIGNYEVQGKLKCSCGQKLGSFHWAGMQCSCGAWVTPAFAVGKSKVDAVGNQTLAVAAAPRPAAGAAANTLADVANNVEPLSSSQDPGEVPVSSEATEETMRPSGQQEHGHQQEEEDDDEEDEPGQT